MDFFFSATILIAILIIILAYLAGRIDISALIASGIVGLGSLFLLKEYWKLIYVVLGFFVLGNLVTRYRFKKKEKEGVAEGIRTFRNVFGNGGAATIYVILYYLISDNPISIVLLFAFIAAMAAATADTFATEIGQAHEMKPRLITNFKRVDVGTSGAVSLLGTIGALAGAAILSSVPIILSLFSDFDRLLIFIIPTISGFIGCNIDSLLGATVEKKTLNKHTVNFIATLSGGFLAAALSFLLLF
jgi:uncharacterized protein (TIGR00297 family)